MEPATTDAKKMTMTAAQVCSELQIHRATLHRYRQSGNFPKPMSIGRAIRWRRVDIEAWLAAEAAKAAEADA